MNNRFLKMAVAGLVLSVSSFANAELITFNEYDNYLWFNDGLVVQSNGFDIKSTSADNFNGIIANSATCGPSCPDNGDFYLLGHGAGFEFTTVDNLGFSLLSFEGAEAHNGIEGLFASHVWVSAVTMDDVVIDQYFELDWINDGDGPLTDFQLFTFNNEFSNLKSVTFEGFGGGQNLFSIDNINYNTTDVSEPSTLAILGLGFMCLAARRFKKQA